MSHNFQTFRPRHHGGVIPVAERGLVDHVGTAELCRLPNVTYRKLDLWFRRGLFGEDPAQGSGTQRVISRSLVPVIKAVAWLALLGYSGERLDRAAATVRMWLLAMDADWIAIGPDGRLDPPGSSVMLMRSDFAESKSDGAETVAVGADQEP